MVGAIVLLIAGPTDAKDNGEPATWVDVLELVLGVLVLLMALRQWRSRPRQGEESPLPKWMGAVERFTPPKSLAVGALLRARAARTRCWRLLRPPRSPRRGSRAATRRSRTPSSLSSPASGSAAPVVVYLVLGDRARPMLDRLKGWMAQHNAVIMSVLCLVIGAKLVGDAITGFAS